MLIAAVKRKVVMASKAVVDAIQARLAGGFTAVPIVDTNTVGEPPADASAFLVLEYPFASSEQISAGAPGANVWREEGAARIVLHVPSGLGIDQGLIWLDEIAALFRGKRFDGVRTWGPSPPTEDETNEDGNYYVLSLSVPYEFDLIG